MNHATRAAVALSLCVVSPLCPQSSPPLVAVRAGTLIDGLGGAPVRNAVTLIEGERIKLVGSRPCATPGSGGRYVCSPTSLSWCLATAPPRPRK